MADLKDARSRLISGLIHSRISQVCFDCLQQATEDDSLNIHHGTRLHEHKITLPNSRHIISFAACKAERPAAARPVGSTLAWPAHPFEDNRIQPGSCYPISESIGAMHIPSRCGPSLPPASTGAEDPFMSITTNPKLLLWPCCALHYMETPGIDKYRSS